MSNMNLCLDFIEKDGDGVWAERKRAAMDVWVELPATLLCLRGGYEEPSALQQSVGRYLVGGKEC